MIEMLNCDCMDYMASLPDKAFDLAIVDPPYGIGASCMNMGSENNTETFYEKKRWDDNCPSQEYFDQLFRVSKNQIIFGGNYFNLPPSRCFIIWDKKIGDNDFSMCEYAWASFSSGSKLFSSGGTHVVQGKRIHPTQKPVALYKWLLSRYAKPGDKILDTHGGSGSIAIACHDLGYDLTWMELDADYYKAACKRYQNHAAQAPLFDPVELTKSTTEAPELFTENQ